ncbi:Tigger transposable element-derived protein 4 [Mus musculus] [Rhizoctonia solani]|uniref:Tigger transposable element-derived protein 4 [Mus musculus] n=1 Tax=Rhizoctonia solani TaxID=456999 RepID=A0A0K6GBF9_9AGAM|nr:Tigger transposable element-derived protein 4 [Mus musculus] [Rhizoctonia solani]
MGFSTFAQSTLSGYLKDESQIQYYANTRPMHGKLKRKISVKLPQAREFCGKFNIPKDKIPAFSNGWLTRLKARFGLRVFKFHGEAASAPVETIQGEMARLTGIMQPYNPDDIFSVDETALFFRLQPSEGLATGHTAGIKADKIRLTYLLGANMSGSEKSEPLVIGRAKRPRCFEGVDGTDLGFYYFWHSTAWMVRSIWQKFLSDLNTRMMRENRHVLLIVDNGSSHSHDASEYSNLHVEFLAPNLTAWIQPMDAGIIRCFKAHYRNGFTRLALERDNAGIDKIYNIDQLQAMKLAATAWDSVTPRTITNCWRHAGLALPTSPDTEAHIDNTLDAEVAAQHEARELQDEVARRPNLLEPEFSQMMEALTLSHPTEQEMTDAEIVDSINVVAST